MAYCVIDFPVWKRRLAFLSVALLPHVAIHQGGDVVARDENARGASRDGTPWGGTPFAAVLGS
jgi:hypothetical protein